MMASKYRNGPVRTCKIVSHDGTIGVKYRREGAFHRMKSSNCTIPFFCGIPVYDTTLSCSTQLPRISGMEKLEARPTSSRSAFSECILFKPIFARYADCFVVSLVIGIPLFPISRNYSDTFLTPPVAALEKEGDFTGIPRAPATRSDCARHAGGMSAMTASPGTPC